MMSKLKEKDLELLSTGKSLDLSSPSRAYLGGQFGTNENDYVQISVYDVNDNFLESSIVKNEDYTHNESGGIKLKTGTILRRMGYDRGRFKAKYHFLRRVAGSHETILVDSNNNIYTGEFNPQTDMNKIGKDLFIKENKYFIHEVSPSRREVRLASQNINYQKYLTDFENLQTTTAIIEGGLEKQYGPIKFFNDTNETTSEDSVNIKLVNEDESFPPNILTNGKLIIPKAYITDHTPPPPIFTDDVFSPVEIDSNNMQARFFLESTIAGQEWQSSYPGDGTFATFHTAFKHLNTPELAKGFIESEEPLAVSSINPIHPYLVLFRILPGGVHQPLMSEIVGVARTIFKPPTYLTWGQDGVSENTATVRIKSNSALAFSSPTTYRWEIIGWDYDTGGGNTIQGFHPLQENQGGTDSYYNGQVYIDTSNGGVSPDRSQVPVGLVCVQENVTDGQGSFIDIKLIGGDIRVGIMLTISNDAGQSSTVFYPCCVQTEWDRP